MYRLHREDDWQARGSRAKNQSCRPRAVSTHCFLHRDALAAKDIEPPHRGGMVIPRADAHTPVQPKGGAVYFPLGQEA